MRNNIPSNEKIEGTMKIYVFPKLSKYNFIFFRIGGHGLGNLLFPLARAIVFANKNNLKLINPTWLQLKLGPYLRFESDKRHYNNLFNPVSDSLSGLRKTILLIKYSWIDENSIFDTKIDSKTRIITYQGIGDYFNPILKDHELVKQTLLSMAKNRHKTALNFNFSNSISLHIRLGDFKNGSQTTPLSWFISNVNQIRAYLKKEIPVYIFSDGSDEELKEVLNLNNTKRISFGSSLADLFALSKSHILIASKNSTFSWWASYLGRMPVIWPKHTTTYPIYYDVPERELFISSNEIINDLFFSNLN